MLNWLEDPKFFRLFCKKKSVNGWWPGRNKSPYLYGSINSQNKNESADLFHKPTFSLWADSQKPMRSEHAEAGPHSIYVPAQENFALWYIQKTEGKDTIQVLSHKIDTSMCIQMKHDFSVTLCQVLKTKFFFCLQWTQYIYISM